MTILWSAVLFIIKKFLFRLVAQHSLHPNPGNPGTEQPGQGAPGAVVELAAPKREYTMLKPIPSKRRCLVPLTSGYPTQEEHFGGAHLHWRAVPVSRTH